MTATTSPTATKVIRMRYTNSSGVEQFAGLMPITLPEGSSLHQLQSDLNYMERTASSGGRALSLVVEDAPVSTEENIESERVKALCQALGNMLKAVGVTNAPGLTGPELLAMADEYVASSEHVASRDRPKPAAKKTAKATKANGKTAKPPAAKKPAAKPAKKAVKKTKQKDLGLDD